jgi:hypothetical protein
MRKTLVVLIIILCVAPAACGCGGLPRDVSTPRKAVLGHWKNTIPGVNPDLYYSPDKVTYSSDKGASITRSYVVISENTAGFTLQVKYGSEVREPSTIGFSADRNEITVLPGSVPELLKYTYIDSKQAP